MIKPWVFEFLPELGSPSTEPNPHDVTTLFGRYLDLWVRDEALGFEGIFFSEHHFGRSYSPSPNLLIAALGPRTKKLRLGVRGVVLPYYHCFNTPVPLRRAAHSQIFCFVKSQRRAWSPLRAAITERRSPMRQ